MTRYASDTSVPADRSRSEIERTLQRYGADSFMYGYQGTQAAVGFQMNGRHVRFVIPVPDRDDPEFTLTPTGRERSASAALEAWEQATRQRWRALALVVKAKLEAVDAGISEFDEEFLAHIVLPNGQSVGEWMVPQVAKAYQLNKMPPLLQLGSGS